MNKKASILIFVMISCIIFNTLISCRKEIQLAPSQPTKHQDKTLTLVEVEKGKASFGIRGLDYLNDVKISPDGAHVYATGYRDNAIAVFERNITAGTLKFVDAHFNGDNGIEGLEGPNTIAISPDGEYLYVPTRLSHGLVVFKRNSTTGVLTFIEFITNGIKDLYGLTGPGGIAISLDGQHVYLCSQTGGALVVFSRDSSTGFLTFIELLQDNFDGIDGLGAASNVIVSQDGKYVYVASQGEDAVTVFSRDSTSGKLIFVEVKKNKAGPVDGLDGAFGIIESPDGAHIYVTSVSNNTVVVFKRNRDNGVLTFIEMQQNGMNTVEGLEFPSGIDFSPDGKYIYVAGQRSNAVVVFSRNSGTGALTFVEIQSKVFNPVLDLRGARGVAMSPDGVHIYITARLGDALNVFKRDTGAGTLSFLEVHKDAGGLENPRGVTVSLDGKYLYTASYRDNSVSVFHRDTNNGALTLIEKHSNGFNGIYGLEGAFSVFISPDGAHLYAMAYLSNAVAVFSRNINTGKLIFLESQINGVNGVEGLNGTMFGHISPDGKHVYVTGFNEHALVVFSRDVMTGQLTFIEKYVAGVDGVEGIFKPSGLLVSPDGKNVYVDSEGEDTIVVFSRNKNSGKLTFMEIHKNNINGVDGLDGGSGDIAISPDGKYLYVAGFNNDAIVEFSRDIKTGELTFIESLINGVNGVRGLDGAWRLALSPDASLLYVTGRNDDAVAFFERNPKTGKLTFLNVFKDGVNGIDGLNGADGITISPDGLNVYIAGRFDNAVAVLKLRNINDIKSTLVKESKAPSVSITPVPRPSLSLEKDEVVWQLQAEFVCEDLNISKENKTKVVDAFIVARRSLREKEEKLRTLGRNRGPQAYLELRQKEIDKFEASLKGMSGKVIVSLSAFISIRYGERWDLMIETVMGFELDKEKMREAVKLVSTYVIEYEKVYNESRSTRDRSLLSTTRTFKENLDSGLAKILTKEQFAKWKEASTSRRARR